MPLLDVDGGQIAQTRAIARFVAREHGLAGETDLEQAKCDEYLEVMDDIGQEVSKYLKEQDAGKKADLQKSVGEEVVPRYLSKFDAIIKKNGNGFLVGKKLTYADIFLATTVGSMASYFPGLDMDKFPAVKKNVEMVVSNPEIKDWIARRPKTPF